MTKLARSLKTAATIVPCLFDWEKSRQSRWLLNMATRAISQDSELEPICHEVVETGAQVVVKASARRMFAEE